MFGLIKTLSGLVAAAAKPTSRFLEVRPPWQLHTIREIMFLLARNAIFFFKSTSAVAFLQNYDRQRKNTHWTSKKDKQKTIQPLALTHTYGQFTVPSLPHCGDCGRNRETLENLENPHGHWEKMHSDRQAIRNWESNFVSLQRLSFSHLKSV